MARPPSGADARGGGPMGPEGLRLLAFSDHFSPRVGGGAERVALEVYRRLASRGAEITVVTTRATDGWRELHPSIAVVEVPTIDLSGVLGLQVSLTRGAAGAARRRTRHARPHIVHANSLEFLTSVAAARVAGRLRVPMVVTAHTAGFGRLPQPWRSAGAVYERSVTRYLLARSQLVVAVSNAVADHLQERLGVEGRVRVVPNGVDHDAFFPPLRESPAETPRLLFVGRLIKNKGPQDLLAAARRLLREGLGLRLGFVGDGPMRSELERATREDPLLRRAVAFEGFVEDVPSRLRRADVLIRPSFTEGMSLSVLEAMATGLCVIASDVPGNDSLIEHGRTGFLFRAGDVGSLTEVIRHVVSHGGERAAVARAARLRSKDHSWERCAEETLGVFLEASSAEIEPAGR